MGVQKCLYYSLFSIKDALERNSVKRKKGNRKTNVGVEAIIVIARRMQSTTRNNYGCPRGVMVKARNCGIVVREFVLQSRYYIHFRTNTLGKGMNLLILPPAMGK